jgi:hypothetical protein
LIAAGAADFVADAQADLPAAASSKKVCKLCAALRRKLTIPDSPGLLTPLFATPSEKSCATNSTIRSPAFSAMRSSCLPKRGGKGPAQFSESSLKRIETIAALAVRLRETVRRLIQACEARSEQVRSA